MVTTPGKKRSAAPAARRSRWRRHIRLNLAACAFVLLLAGLLLADIGPQRALVIAFTAAGIGFLLSVTHLFATSDSASIRARAVEEDQGRWAVLLSSVAVSTVVLFAVALELGAGSRSGAWEIALAATSLLVAWTFINTIFTLHYAHAFYGDGDNRGKRGGLDFPGDADPDYWDFAYFSFVIGMTFQVSDVPISDRGLRRIVLAHALVAFVFNVILIGLTVNVVAGKA